MNYQTLQTALNVVLVVVVCLQFLSIRTNNKNIIPTPEKVYQPQSTDTVAQGLLLPSQPRVLLPEQLLLYQRSLDTSKPFYNGVAATVILGCPKSLRNRYSVMINQLIITIPTDWIVQIFYDTSVASAVESVESVAIQKQVVYGRVVVTELPDPLKGIKRKYILKSTWLWENMLAETVLLVFSVNTVLCGNSPFNLSYFTQFDYVGAPWPKGAGGSNEISLRKKSAVLEALQALAEGRKTSDGGREDTSLVKMMVQRGAAVANETETMKFAMTNFVAEGMPFANVGTLQQFNDEVRRKYLDYCPELKMVFPSMHNPFCFGHSTFADFCFKSLCLDGGVDCNARNFSFQFNNRKEDKVTMISISSTSKT